MLQTWNEHGGPRILLCSPEQCPTVLSPAYSPHDCSVLGRLFFLDHHMNPLHLFSLGWNLPRLHLWSQLFEHESSHIQLHFMMVLRQCSPSSTNSACPEQFIKISLIIFIGFSIYPITSTPNLGTFPENSSFIPIPPYLPTKSYTFLPSLFLSTSFFSTTVSKPSLSSHYLSRALLQQ